MSTFTRAYIALGERGTSVRVYDDSRAHRGWGEVVTITEGDWSTRTPGLAEVKWADGSVSTIPAPHFNKLRLEVRP